MNELSMMKTVLAVALPLILLCLPAIAADRNSVALTGGVWSHNVESDYSQFNARSGTQVDADTLRSDGSSSQFFAVSVGFKNPWLPALRLRYSELSAESVDKVTARRTIQGTEFVISGEVLSAYEFDFSELSASWRLDKKIGNGLFYFDYGFSLQYLEGHIRSDDQASAISESIDTPLPALHFAAGMMVQGKIGIDAEVQGAKYDDNSLTESEFTLSILPNGKSGIELGYRTFDLDYETDNSSSIDVQFRGPFFSGRMGF